MQRKLHDGNIALWKLCSKIHFLGETCKKSRSSVYILASISSKVSTKMHTWKNSPPKYTWSFIRIEPTETNRWLAKYTIEPNQKWKSYIYTRLCDSRRTLPSLFVVTSPLLLCSLFGTNFHPRWPCAIGHYKIVNLAMRSNKLPIGNNEGQGAISPYYFSLLSSFPSFLGDGRGLLKHLGSSENRRKPEEIILCLFSPLSLSSVRNYSETIK